VSLAAGTYKLPGAPVPCPALHWIRFHSFPDVNC
jgi:hypothetical protein